jgi:leucine dehydrogenase
MAVSKNILKLSPQDFIRYLKQENISRFCFVYDSAGKKNKLISSIRGCYVTAVTDMANVFFKTRFTTYIPHRLGGSGNPSVPTARGVVCGVESAFDFLGMGTLKGKTIAVQGMGHVAEPPIKYLFDMDVKHVIACDINPYVVKEVKGQLSGKNLDVSVVPPDDLGIYSVECDIFAPCATGAILNPSTIPMLKANIVCGAANNQLEYSIRDDEMLFGRKIVYVPDFLTNRMGIMSCANEQYGYVTKDSSIEMHLSKEWEYSIYHASNKVLKKSAETARPPGQVAFEMASRLSFQNHPICGHRGQEIINSLVANRWCEISSLDRKVMST